MPKAKSLEEVKFKLKETHNGKIDLIGGYTTVKSKAFFRCDKEHVWEAQVFSVINTGNKCPKCAGKLITNEDAHENIKKIHGNELVMLSKYIGSNKKTRFQCKCSHIWTTDYSHIVGRKSGCPKCKGVLSITLEETNKRIFEKHGNLIKLVGKYKGYKKVNQFECDKGHKWLTTPHSVSSGSGCKVCNKTNPNKKTPITPFEIIVKKANLVHSNKYNYEKAVYTKQSVHFLVTCEEHGDFSVTPTNHINHKSGCPACARIKISEAGKKNPTGWSYTNWVKASKRSKEFDSYKVYIIECWNKEERFYKIGKTYQKIKRRFHTKKSLPYDYSIIHIFNSQDALEICTLEKDLHRENKNNKYTPSKEFNGMFECFSSVNLPQLSTYLD